MTISRVSRKAGRGVGGERRKDGEEEEDGEGGGGGGCTVVVEAPAVVSTMGVHYHFFVRNKTKSNSGHPQWTPPKFS